ncbi:alanine aminotransferase 2-like [Oppia nitens]|uniref:alanine aminotransferase 2-like n=1 Tax=Oppia nitens TaxID=1686743 RepID=UPI0023D9CC2A|nr:alanine aminotransferase 2-like [Oppia nitens]
MNSIVLKKWSLVRHHLNSEYLKTLTRRMSSSSLLTIDSINQRVKHMEYAVRGPIPQRASQLESQLKSGQKLPFDAVIRANIGDCHAMNQKPITFFRQVLSGAANPIEMHSNPKIPKEVKERVNELLDGCGGRSVGAYSEATGVEIIRRHIAQYIRERDGLETDWRNVVLTTGASEGAKAILSFINTTATDGIPTGVMVPIPQYPLYSATLTELGMNLISYYLDEQNQWALNINELRNALQKSRSICKPKAIVVINPGNPTGSVLTKENIENIIKFADENKLMIIADEVYQHNIWDPNARFYSFKKVMQELGIKLELVSMMSASKGFMGECGLRGGYLELSNFDEEVKAVFYKMLSARLCSSVLGQIAMDCVVNPPPKGTPSYELYVNEKQEVLKSLRERAELIAETFNSIPGIESNGVAGAMYAFPKIVLPSKAITAAEEKRQKPDFFYCMELLETTGICVVPGSGFGQIDGTYHFRTTILPQTQTMHKMMDKFKQFHINFINKYK